MNPSMLSEHCEGKWKSISVGNVKYSIRAIESSDGSWTVSLTNLIEIWSEELDRGKILQKCEKLNPYLSVEDIDVHQFVREIFEDIPRHATQVSVEQIKLSSELEGGVFAFDIDLTRGSAQQLWEEVTMPLCLAAGELRRRQTILMDLIKKKDAEIAEYKLNGAELIRKNIRTEPFHEDLFKKNVPAQNAESCQNAFEEIMELRGHVKVERSSVKTEPAKTCSTEILNSRETSVKIEVEENSERSNSDLVVDNGTLTNIDVEQKSETVIQESNVLGPKAEKSSSPESPQLPKPSKSVTESNNVKKDMSKRTRSAPTLSAKRTKKNIHDFIK